MKKQDAGWWKAFQRGEEWAFRTLHQRFERPVLQFLSDRVGDRELARDLGQEVFLKLHRFKGALRLPVDSVEAVSGWVFTIARNTATDWFRGARLERESTRSLEPEEDFAAPQGRHLVELRDRRALFWSWLKGLTSSQRRVVWLRIVRGLSYEEIASAVGVSVSAAKCLFHRATQSVQEFAPA